MPEGKPHRGRYKIVSKGERVNTEITDMQTGEVMKNVVKVEYAIDANLGPTAHITLFDFDPEVEIEAEFDVGKSN